MVVRTTLALLGSVIAFSHPSQAAPGQRIEVPAQLTTLADGTPRWSVPVVIDGRSVNAMLDTGSFGLRILSLGAAGAGRLVRYAYASGVELSGPARTAHVELGGAAVDVPVQFVARVGCVAEARDCPAAHIRASEYRIGGKGVIGQGFEAILGISMPQAGGTPPLPNPLTSLAASWLLDLPRPGHPTGRLVLNPTVQETDGFVALPLDPAMRGRGGGLNDALPGCLTLGRSPLCGAIILDSGDAGVRVGFRPEQWIPYTGRAVLEIGRGADAAKLAFMAGEETATMVQAPRAARSEGVVILTGALAYARGRLLYDNNAHTIAFREDPATR